MSKETKNCKLGELDEVLEALFEDGLDISYSEVHDPDDEEGLISIEGIRIVVSDLKLSARAGDYCRYDEEEGQYMPDFSITLIYDEEEADPSKYLYWEQDPYEVAIYNYVHSKGLTMEELNNLDCIVEIEL